MPLERIVTLSSECGPSRETDDVSGLRNLFLSLYLSALSYYIAPLVMFFAQSLEQPDLKTHSRFQAQFQNFILNMLIKCMYFYLTTGALNKNKQVFFKVFIYDFKSNYKQTINGPWITFERDAPITMLQCRDVHKHC